MGGELSERGSPTRALIVAAGCAALMGCAPVVPLLAGGGTTPAHRVDVSLGGAARVPLGRFADGEPLLAQGDPGGVVPVAVARVGLARGWDVDLAAAGPLTRASLRREVRLDRESDLRPVLLAAGGLYGGLVWRDGAKRGGRIGVDLPLLLGLRPVGGLLEMWVGPRLGIERVWARVSEGTSSAQGSATGIRLGGTLGLAVGFRSLHALLELSAGWERWTGALGGRPVAATGIVLDPAFALRYRL